MDTPRGKTSVKGVNRTRGQSTNLDRERIGVRKRHGLAFNLANVKCSTFDIRRGPHAEMAVTIFPETVRSNLRKQRYWPED